MDSAQVILWRGGLDGTTFSYVNQEAETLLGYPIQTWIRSSAFWIDHVHPGDRPLLRGTTKVLMLATWSALVYNLMRSIKMGWL